MSEQEAGSHIPLVEQLEPTERLTVQIETQEARHQLDREVCLNNLVDELDIECSPQVQPLLVSALIEKEKSLPKLFTEMSPRMAKAQINKVLPSITQQSSEQALRVTKDARINTSEALAERKNKKAELTQEQELKLTRREKDKTTIAVQAKSVTLKSVLEDEKDALLEENPDLKGQALLDALANTDIAKKTPQLQKLLADFGRILGLAQNEEDRAILETKMATVDFASLPDPVVFIQSEIMGSSDISQATQDAIAREFKITPYKVVTGSDVQRAFGETVVNPETGAEEPQFTDKNPLTYRPGIQAYNGKAGEQFIRLDVEPPVQFDVTGWNPNDIADVSEYGALFIGFEQAGISQFMVHSFHLPNALNPQFDPLEAIQSRQIVDALLGFNEGYDGKIYGAERTDYFKWFVQMLSPRGDWAQGDMDINASHQALKDLGVRHDNGDLNLNVLQSVGSYARGIYGTGAPDYYALQRHLHEIYGDRVPLTSDKQQDMDRL